MTILVATDFSDPGRPVTDLAADFARTMRTPLCLIHVIDGPELPLHRQRLAAEETRLRKRGCSAEGMIERGGGVGERIAKIAESMKPLLVVVGAEGEGLRRGLGTVATDVLRHSTSQLLVVRAADRLARFVMGARLHALVAVALEEDALDPALQESLALLARFGGVDADIAHYAQIEVAAQGKQAARPDAIRLLDKRAREALGELPDAVVPTVIVRDAFGRIDVHLADLARERDVDLVVCSSHRRGFLERLASGSIAEGVLRHAPVSVLISATR